MDELKHINSVFLDAFDAESLARLVRFTFNKDLDSITRAKDLTSLVFYLTRWAEQHGQMGKLLDAAQASLPENGAIQELSYTPRDLSVVRSRSNYLMDQQESLAIIMLKIEQIERDLEQIRQIVVGPFGDNGVRAVSVENSRKLIEIMRTIERLEAAINKPPDLLASPQAKLFFYTMFFILSATAIMVAGGSLNWW